MNKTKFLLIIIFILLIIFPISNTVFCNASEIKYYGLLLHDFDIPDYNSNVKVYNPNGIKVEVKSGKIFLQALGDYILEYSNIDKRKLNVRSKSFDAVYDFEFKFLDSYVAGNYVKLPKVNISTEIAEYKDYDVIIKCNDELLEKISEYNNCQKEFFIEKGGNYTISYIFEDIFGLKNNMDLHFSAVEQKIINVPNINETIPYYTALNLENVFGFYKAQMYEVSIVVINPNGSFSAYSGGDIICDQIGKYTLKIVSRIDNEDIIKTVSFNVAYDNSNLIEPTKSIKSIISNYPLPDYCENFGKNGVLVMGNGINSKFFYKEIIDLNKLTKNDNLIEFQVLNSSTSKLDAVKLKIIDAYDFSNVITVYWRKNFDYNLSSYMTVIYKDYNMGRDNNSASSKGLLRNYYGAVTLSSFSGFYTKNSYPFNVQFDIIQNIIYTKANKQSEQLNLIDLDNPEEIAQNQIFNGFKTGEVFLEIELLNNNSSGVFITAIAGNDTSSNNYIVNNSGNNIVLENQIIDGVVNYNYEIAKPIKNYITNNIPDYKLYFNNKDITDSINDGKFMPVNCGEYTLIYSIRDNYNNTLTRKEKFKILGSPIEINIELPENENVRILDYYSIPNINVSGGIGTVKVSLEVLLNGNNLVADNLKRFYINEIGELKIKINAVDSIGYSKTKEYIVNIDNNFILVETENLPRVLRAGDNFNLPKVLKAFDYNTQNQLNSILKVFSDEEKNNLLFQFNNAMEENIIKVPDFNKLYLQYEVIVNEKTFYYNYNIDILPKIANNVKDLLLYEKKVNTTLLESGIIFKFGKNTKNTKIGMPYPISSDNLNIKFGYNTDFDKFNTIKIILTDCQDSEKKVILKIFRYNNSFRIKINDSELSTNIEVGLNVYSFDCGNVSDNEYYRGKKWNNFEITLDGFAHQILKADNTVLSYIDNYYNGLIFNNFDSRACYIDFEVEEISGDVEFILYSVANQKFSYFIQSHRDGDNAGPTIATADKLKNCEINYGSTVVIPKAIGYDVLQGTAEIKLTIISPSNISICQNIDINHNYYLKITEYGNYSIKYISTDRENIKSEKLINIVVKYKNSPELTINGNYETEYNKGEIINVFSYIQNNSASIEVKILLKTPDNKYRFLEISDKIKFVNKGTYQIIYIATDNNNNNKRIVTNIKVI